MPATLGVRSLTQGAPANMLAPLNRNLHAWWSVLPWRLGGTTWFDLVSEQVSGPDTALVWRGTGAPGGFGALQFLGSGARISLLPTLPLKQAASYTWAFWVRPDSFAQWSSLLTYSVTNGAPPELSIYVHTTADASYGPVTAGVSVGWSRGASGYVVAHSSDNVLAVGVWAHLIVTYTGSLALASRWAIYVNGRDVTVTGDVASTGSLTDFTPATVNIGRDHYSDPSFVGALSDFRVWRDRALSASEVRDLYRTSRQGSQQELTYQVWPPVWAVTAAGAGILRQMMQHAA